MTVDDTVRASGLLTLGAAAAAIDRGWAVFPVAGKHPLPGSRGLHDATRDYGKIDAWWPAGTTRGLAVATGTPSKCWVLDLDGPEAVDRFLDLQEAHGQVERTLTAATSRGFHLYFAMPSRGDVRNSAGRVAEGIDVRGTGGYVVIPPSRHPSGVTYAWAKGRGPDELAPIAGPAWLLAMVQPSQRPGSLEEARSTSSSLADRARYVEVAIERECEAVARAPEGTRNDRLNKAAFVLARFVESGEADAYEVARSLARAARRAGLTLAETQKTIQSAFQGRGVAA